MQMRESALRRVDGSGISKIGANILGDMCFISSSLSPGRLMLPQVHHEAEKPPLVAQGSHPICRRSAAASGRSRNSPKLCQSVRSRSATRYPYRYRWTSINVFAGCGIRQVHRCGLPVSPSRYVCKRIHAPQRMLFGKLPAIADISLVIYSLLTL